MTQPETPRSMTPSPGRVGKTSGAEGDSKLRSKARALAKSVWQEHRGSALRFESLSPEASDLLVDCCLKGICVGIVAGGLPSARVDAIPTPSITPESKT